MRLRQKFLSAAALYIVSFSILWIAYFARVTADPTPNGEELGVAYRNVVFFELQEQFDGYSSNFSATAWQWIGSHVVPISVNSQRIWKLFFAALVPVTTFFLFQPLLGAGWIAVVTSTIFWLTSPTFSWYSVQSLEYVLSIPFTFLLFYLALTFRLDGGVLKILPRLLGLALLTGWSMHLYGAGMAMGVASQLVIVWRLWSGAPTRRRIRRISRILSYTFLATAAVCWPMYYFKHPGNWFAGGGSFPPTWDGIKDNLYYPFLQAFVSPQSTYIAWNLKHPAFPYDQGGIAYVLLALIGLAAYWKRWPLGWLLLAGFGCLVVGSFSGGMPGIRRFETLIVVMLLLSGLGVQTVIEHSRARLTSRATTICAAIIFSIYLGWIPNEISGFLCLLLFLSLIEAVFHRFRGGQLLIYAYLIVLMIFPFKVFFETYSDVLLTYREPSPDLFPGARSDRFDSLIEGYVDRMQHEQLTLNHPPYQYSITLLLELICRRRGLKCIEPVVLGQIDERAKNWFSGAKD